MKRLSGFLLFVCWLSTSAWGQQDLAQKLDSLVHQLLPRGSEVGISIYDLTAKESLYRYRDTSLSRPASTLKLITTITALSRPDGDEPFRTELWYQGIIEQDTLKGDVYVVGGFDPEFGEQGMKALVDGVVALPFSVISGRVYGDVSMKDSLYFGNGWMWDDIPYGYQPYLSPLMYEKGVVKLTVSPAAQQGVAATVVAHPLSSYYTLSNETQTRTPAAGKYSVTRDWLLAGNNICVSGNVQRRHQSTVSMHSSPDYFMHTLLDRLRSEGIRVLGGYEFADFRRDSTSILISCWETPVLKVVENILKESDNLNAEALLYRMGAQATGRKRVSAADGIEEIVQLASALGHSSNSYKLADGCGLSNYDYISPAFLLDFLTYAYSQTELFQNVYKSLPIAGVDGTLQHRMKQGKAYKRVHAKTGSYTGINGLAGYLQRRNGHDVAFVILNQNVLSGAQARALQDAVCNLLCQ